MKITHVSLLLLLIIINISCSDKNSDEPTSNTKGRFDNQPFAWDYTSYDNMQKKIFVGEALLSINSDGQEPPFTSRQSNIYIGAAYKQSFIKDKTFDNEIVKERNPIDLIFDFFDPFITQTTNPTGSDGYTNSLDKAVNSTEFANYISSGFSSSTNYSLTEYYTSNDIQKGFCDNIALGKAFAQRVDKNNQNKNTTIKGKLLARIEGTSFTAYMDQPAKDKGFFLSSYDNTTYADSIKPAYIQSITYGTLIYLAAESHQYNYNELKNAIESILISKTGNNTSSIDQITQQIIDKSNITLLVIGNNSKASYYIDQYSDLNKLLSPSNYTPSHFGHILYIQAKTLPQYELLKLEIK